MLRMRLLTFCTVPHSARLAPTLRASPRSQPLQVPPPPAAPSSLPAAAAFAVAHPPCAPALARCRARQLGDREPAGGREAASQQVVEHADALGFCRRGWLPGCGCEIQHG